MKILAFILLCCIVFLFVTKEEPKPEVIEVKETTAQQSCNTSNNAKDHNGCCISSGRGAYILNQNPDLHSEH